MSKIEDASVPSKVALAFSNKKTDVELSVKSFSYTWTVSNFSKCFGFAEAKIHSPEFTFENSNWRILITTSSENDTNTLSGMQIRLLKIEEGDSPNYIKYKFSVLKNDGSFLTKEASSSFVDTMLLGHRLSFSKVKEDIASVLKDDRLTVYCELVALLTSEDPDESKSEKKAKNRTSKSSLPRSRSNVKRDVAVGVRLLPRLGITPPVSPQTHFIPRFRNISNGRKHLQSEGHWVIYNVALFLSVILVCGGMFIVENVCFKDELPNVIKMNELIIDSTIKINHIAEALNLTDVKIKSLELLDWYDKTYDISVSKAKVNSPELMNSIHKLNISDLDFSKVMVNFSKTVDSNHKLNISV